MKTVIYWFSGTGNCLAVARSLAEKTAADLVPIASLAGADPVVPAAESIGIVFPCYFGDIPPFVRRFAQRLSGIGPAYVWSVCTYGGGSGESFQSLDAALRAGGGRLAAWFGLHMPQNAFRKPWENYGRIYRAAERKLARIARRVETRRPGTMIGNPLYRLFLALMHPLFKPLYRKELVKLSGAPENRPMDELLHLSDRSYRVNGSCDGCGICARVCPVGNVGLEGKRPVWRNRCEGCLACYDWCPKSAIEGGISAASYHYRHTEMGAKDIMVRKDAGTGKGKA